MSINISPSQILKSRVFQHLAFWLFAFFVLAGFFAKEYGELFLHLNLIYTGLFLLSILIVVYLNLKIFIPRFLQAQKWGLYIISLLAGIALGIWLNILTFEYLSDWLFPGYYFISYYEIRDIFNFIVVFVGTTTLLKLAKSWFEINEQKKTIIRLEKEKLDAELSALKSQINPHFLFNSLNSMYALSLDNDPRVSELLLKLSAGMRYMLYETNEHFVLLKKELEYLNNYLDLQKLRTQHKANISFEINGMVKDQKVIPLVFIPFVENAFKHGIKGDIEDVFIDLSLNISENRISFSVKNNKGQVGELPDLPGGVGLENIKKRLQLLYTNEHDLQINAQENTYEITLNIPTR